MANPDPAYYLNILHPLQDEVLSITSDLQSGLYLSGGTAVSRGYLHHRFSEDLDLFADDAPEFGVWTERLRQALERINQWHVTTHLRESRFMRLSLQTQSAVLKIEIINDVPARVGAVRRHPVLGLLDCPENLLSNKITAQLDRNDPKDLADIWGLCIKLGLPLAQSIEGAQGKAAGVFPPDLARALCEASEGDWDSILWFNGPTQDTYLRDLHALGESLLNL